MRIPAIGLTSSVSAFRGILTDETVSQNNDVHYDNGLEQDIGERYTLRERTYYPYKGETKASVSKTVSKYRSYGHYSDGLVYVVNESRVNVKPSLPFTESECVKYMKAMGLSEKEFIQSCELFKLLKFFEKRLHLL